VRPVRVGRQVGEVLRKTNREMTGEISEQPRSGLEEDALWSPENTKGRSALRPFNQKCASV